MNYVNQINQLKKEIASLRKAEAQETQKEADIQGKNQSCERSGDSHKKHLDVSE